MKEATGETSMTFITIAAIALIAAFIGYLWPNVIKPAIEKKWDVIEDSNEGVYIPYVINDIK